MRFLPRKLWLQLLVPILILVIIVGAVSGYIHMRSQGDQLLDTMITGADQLSGSIASATWHAMLDDNRESAYQIMQTIATKQGINRIRIFNKEGRVMYSTAPGDTGSVDKAAQACYICHASDRPLVRIDVPSRARVFREVSGKRTLGIVTPVYNEPACSNAECHAHPAETNVLGVIDVSLDLSAVDKEISLIQQRAALISLVLSVLIVVILIVFTRKYVDAPIHKLIEATHAVSAMNLDKPVKITSSEELGDLAHSFDTMRVQLKTAIDDLNTLAENLEIKVTERTEQLKVAQQKLFHTDRLASLGQLSASVAHEINNPLSGVLNLSMLMQRIIKEDGIPAERIPEVRKYLSQVVTETARVGRIVQDLLAFSRRSKPHQRGNVNFNAIVSTTVNLIGHKLKLMNVEMDLRLDENLPPIHCDASQMQQVLINLIMNGAEAAQGHPEAHVRVTTRASASNNEFTLEVADTGDGIKPEHLAKLFTPFFTTKGEGKGIGLGLAVVYGIVKDHGGDIDVDTKLGKGTSFIVTMPIDGAGTAASASGTG